MAYFSARQRVKQLGYQPQLYCSQQPDAMAVTKQTYLRSATVFFLLLEPSQGEGEDATQQDHMHASMFAIAGAVIVCVRGSSKICARDLW